jgi:hypothetical protein
MIFENPLATYDGQDFALRVAADRKTGTADYAREIAPSREGGTYIRAVPRPGGGSVMVTTLPVPAAGDSAVVAATLDDELNALRLAEHTAAG